ncbi:MAG TPA: hypothetical protein VM054_10280 [bacterium]|nr:hypothetical protein [bacterium]
MKRMMLVFLAVFLSTVYAQDLLIGHTDPGQTSGVMANIAGDPFYDTVDLEDWTSQTPTVDHLQEYDCVFTWSHSAYQDKTTLGNNLADYVDQGGAVVIVNLCWSYPFELSGRIMSDTDYCPLELVWRAQGREDRQGLGDYDADHPIMDGVESITEIEYWEYLDVRPSVTWLADLTNFYALAGINADQNVVGINLYPGDYRYWEGDGWILFNNAIRYLMDTDTAPPYVDDIYPGDGECEIPEEVVFHCKDEQSCVDSTTISFTLQDETLGRGCAIGTGAAVGAPVSPAALIPGDLDIDDTDPKDVVCTWTPDEPLGCDRWYTATVDGSLADVLGNEMGEDFVWEFGGFDVEETSWGVLKTAF